MDSKILFTTVFINLEQVVHSGSCCVDVFRDDFPARKRHVTS